MASNILSDRDTNVQVNPSTTPMEENEKPKSLEYHRQVLASKMKEE
jgi:hypothetical protein